MTPSSTASAPIDSVIFDWGGTLTPWHTVDVADSWVAAVGPGAEAQALVAAEAAIWIRCRDEHRSATLAEVEELAGIALTKAQRSGYFDWWEAHTYTDPQVPQLFTDLADRGIKVGVLSNTIWPRAEHERYFRRDDVLHLIDGAVYSCEIPWTKPHPEAFLAAMAAVGGSDPSKVVFVGDRLFDDIHGAKRAGMRAVHIPHSVIPSWQVSFEGTPDAVINELSELIGQVDRWRNS